MNCMLMNVVIALAEWRTTGRCHSREQEHFYKTVSTSLTDLYLSQYRHFQRLTQHVLRAFQGACLQEELIVEGKFYI